MPNKGQGTCLATENYRPTTPIVNMQMTGLRAKRGVAAMAVQGREGSIHFPWAKKSRSECLVEGKGVERRLAALEK